MASGTDPNPAIGEAAAADDATRAERAAAGLNGTHPAAGVPWAGAHGESGGESGGRAVGTPRVVAIIVTWNRKQAVDAALRCLAAQTFDRSRLDVVVVDNGSTDGTAAFLSERWRPTAVYDNPTRAAHEPAFSRTTSGEGRCAGGFGSFTLVRNAVNHGGCGGFNTGLALVDSVLDGSDRPVGYVWLVDDDVELPAGALEQLVRTAEGDGQIGLVGSRTVDFHDRETTIETTIYFDPENGWMGPDPPAGHAMAADHARWVGESGGTRGRGRFTGLRRVDVVSACSLLARWSAVKQVGFWDWRFFIYCDDADWSLRFARAGWKVVCDLDAVVYHTIWLSKLTPTRGYYAGRNLLWLMQKSLDGEALRSATLRRLASLLVQSRKAMTHCRLFHAEIFRRTAADVVSNRGGKLEGVEPPATPLLEGLERAGLLGADRHVAVMCSHPESVSWAEEWRSRVRDGLSDRGDLARMPRMTYVCRDHAAWPGPTHGLLGGVGRAGRVVFRPRMWSKVLVQWWLLRDPPDGVVVFDQHNECPLLWSRRNVHVDRRSPGTVQVEGDGWARRAWFMARWAWTGVRCLWHARTVRPFVRTGKYG